jgi:hypothetical protein
MFEGDSEEEEMHRNWDTDEMGEEQEAGGRGGNQRLMKGVKMNKRLMSMVKMKMTLRWSNMEMVGKVMEN